MTTALDTILGAARLADAISAFRAALSPLGIDTFSAGEVDTAHRNRAGFSVVDWPDSWRRFYFSSSILQRDPVVENLGLYGGRAFTWADLRADRRLARGRTDAEIGAELGISATTAHEHVERAKRRLETHTRAELAAVAVALGIVAA